jgi:hypothetical protein
MTSEEINRLESRGAIAETDRWMAEIALQLALLNERLRAPEGVNVVLCASNDTIPVSVA